MHEKGEKNMEKHTKDGSRFNKLHVESYLGWGKEKRVEQHERMKKDEKQHV